MRKRAVGKIIGTSLIVSTVLFVSCIFDKEAKRGSEVENEIRVGSLKLADGGPAVNARVRVYDVAHVPDTLGSPQPDSGADPAFTTRTDSQGKYRIDPLPEGEYNVLGDLDGAVSYQDSILISERTGRLATDTLAHPGSLLGWVRLEPNHDPRSVTVQVLGTNSYANVDTGGRFLLSRLARGNYSLRVLANRPDYAPLFVTARIRSGFEDTLGDTLVPSYTGIPVVTGLHAEYDTLRGVVRLAWNPVDYRDRSEYLVFRDSGLALVPSELPIGKSSDTVFLDTLYLPSRTGLFDIRDSLDRLMAYRVKVRNKSGQIGLAYGAADVGIAAPAKVRTEMEFGIGESRWDPELRGDSVSVKVRLRNPTRRIAQVTWYIGGGLSGDSLAHTLGSGRQEADSIRFLWVKQGPFRIHLRARDDGGTVWKDSVDLPGNTGPRISGTPLVKADANIDYLFRPTVHDPDEDGLIYSVSNPPGWAGFDSLKGTLSGTPANSDAGVYRGIRISVSDGRRADSLPSFDLTVMANAWTVGKPLGQKFESGFSGTLDGKVYLFRDWYNPDQSVDRYDPSADAWSRAVALPENWILHGAHLIGGKFYVVTTPNVNPPSGFSMRVYDPGANTWEDKGPLALGSAYFKSAACDGRIYFFGNDKTLVEAYNPETNALTPGKSSPKAGSSRMSAVALKDRIYLLGGVTGPAGAAPDSMMIYRPATDTWTLGPAMAAPRTSFNACAYEDRIFAFGGILSPETRFPLDAVEEFDPGTQRWSAKRSMPTARFNPACSEAGGKLIVIGGMDGFGGTGSASLSVEAYDPGQDR